MSHAVRKCASSTDPRHWHYLPQWQRWGRYMPPWNYSWHAPLTFSLGGAPFFDKPCVFEKGIDGLSGDALTWLNIVSIFIPDVGETPFAFFNTSLTTFNPDSPPLDSMGNPYTVGISGSFGISITILGTIFATFNGQFYLPDYDAEFVMPIANTLPYPFPQFSGNITMRPVKWDTPALL